MLPNFLIIGAQKCGTTSLFSALAGHPQVFRSRVKEPHFFSQEYERGLAHYRSYFEGVTNEIAIGEASTTYTLVPWVGHAAERIATHLPDAKLIYIVRHPLRRIESSYMHKLNSGRAVPASVNELADQRPEVIENTLYWQQISYYRARFSDEQILVLFFEQLTADPVRVLARCAAFLGIDPSFFHVPAPLAQRNRSLGRRRRDWLARLLVNVPGSTTVRRMLPQAVRDSVYEAIAPPILTHRPRLDGDAAARVIEKVRPDAEQFLQFYGQPATFWQWDVQPSGGELGRSDEGSPGI